MENTDENTLPRAPIPSAPAKGAVSQLHTALNNLAGQLRESLFIIPEAAPAVGTDSALFQKDTEDFADPDFHISLPPGGDNSVIGSGRANTEVTLSHRLDGFGPTTDPFCAPTAENVTREIVERAENLTILLNAVQDLAKALPEQRSSEEYYERIKALQQEKDETEAVLRSKFDQLRELNVTIHSHLDAVLRTHVR